MTEDNKLNKRAPGNSILSSLTLEEQIKNYPSNVTTQVKCLQCEQYFEFPSFKDDYLAHLFLSHRIVIADVEDIAELVNYLSCWEKEFRGHELEEFCTTILLDQLPDGTPAKNERYYLLSDILPKDYELRKRLHTERLERALSQHQFERTDRTYSRECLYCRDIIKGLRSEFLEHLFNKHFLQLGKPENLVYVDELIDLVQQKLENLICLFCEKIFKDRATLKEHMRKKGHKRINPSIKLYDKYFLINYKNEKPQHVKNIKNRRVALKSKINESKPRSDNALRPKQTQDHEGHNDKIVNSEDSDSDWSDWDGEEQMLTCLYCQQKDTDFNRLKSHMHTAHYVDFDKKTENLTFYQKIKVVNYIRRQIHILRCVTCDKQANSIEDLQDHMSDQSHYGIGMKVQWDKPEFFFPTYEDDGILCLLDDSNENELDDSSVVIISEDSKARINREAEALSLENFVI